MQAQVAHAYVAWWRAREELRVHLEQMTLAERTLAADGKRRELAHVTTIRAASSTVRASSFGQATIDEKMKAKVTAAIRLRPFGS